MWVKLMIFMHFIFPSDIGVSVCVGQVYCYFASCYIYMSTVNIMHFHFCEIKRVMSGIGVSVGKGEIE